MAQTFGLFLRRGQYSLFKEKPEKNDIVLREGEPFLEYQDQVKGKWYERFVNPVRVKYGDGSTPYKDLPYNNGILKPIVRLGLSISLILISQVIWWAVFLSILL